MILTDDNFSTIVRGGLRGTQALRQPAQVHPLHAGGARHLHRDVPGGDPVEHRRREERLTAVQILWINFLITGSIGIALGLDKATPGLMKRKPRPRSASIMSRAVLTTVGLAGVFMSARSIS